MNAALGLRFAAGFFAAAFFAAGFFFAGAAFFAAGFFAAVFFAAVFLAGFFAAGFFSAFFAVAIGLLSVVLCGRTMPIGLKLSLLSRARELHRGRLYRIFPRKKHDLRGISALRRTSVARVYALRGRCPKEVQTALAGVVHRARIAIHMRYVHRRP